MPTQLIAKLEAQNERSLVQGMLELKPDGITVTMHLKQPRIMTLLQQCFNGRKKKSTSKILVFASR
jgi:hypothetical protein